MTNTHQRQWTRGTIPICTATNQHAFESISEAKAYFDRYCFDGVNIDRIEPCKFCDGFHVQSHARELSGASSNSGTRQQTLRLPAEATITGRRLSERDTERYHENQR